MGVQVPRRVHAEDRKEGAVWANQAALGHCKLRNFLGHKFWARGYFVSTVGRDEETIRAYIKNHEIADKRLV